MIEQNLSDNIIVWTVEDGSVRITQMIDDTIDVDAEIEKIAAENPDFTFRFKGKMSEHGEGIGLNFFYPALVVDSENRLAYDMTKSRSIWRDFLRALRAPKLVELDLAYQRADEVGDAALKAQIVVKKNILRDCTENPDIDTATSINDLRRTLPELLAD